MRIVVAVDGSSCSTSSVQTLAHFTPPEELTLVHALHLPDLNYPMITPDLRAEAQEEIKAQLRQEGEAILDEARKHLPADFSHVHRVHQIGHPVDVIVETARSARSNLIMVGARGLGPVKELILGSVSHRILMHAPCSTMVIKAPLTQLRKILLPIEGREDAEAALQFLALQPFRSPVEVEVFAVWPQPQLSWPTTVGQSDLLEIQAIEEARERMKSITDRLTQMNIGNQAHVGIGNPAYAILEQAKASQSDLIMMGTHGRGGLSRFLMGSVSHSVLRHKPYFLNPVKSFGEKRRYVRWQGSGLALSLPHSVSVPITPHDPFKNSPSSPFFSGENKWVIPLHSFRQTSLLTPHTR